ncbi:MAG: hypothetical protein JO301_12185 [Chitinophagaceae bacterium]|nr:hypothetical protein [Chitinophagaceae bacterium]
MNLNEIFNEKSLKQKDKVSKIAGLILAGTMDPDALLAFAGKSADAEKASCIEAIEFATKTHPQLATENCLKFVTASLADSAPRVKWESAKVIGNIAPVFPTKLKAAVKQLLINSEHNGTVVRWATAYALGEILKLRTALNKDLQPAIEAICRREEDNGVKKKYLDALKKAAK